MGEVLVFISPKLVCWIEGEGFNLREENLHTHLNGNQFQNSPDNFPV